MKKRGMAAALARKREKELAAKRGNAIAANDFEHLERQMSDFTEKLSKFSADYQSQIKKDPLFRSQFTKMCGSLGVDPLASSKSAWAGMSGVGDFYYELAVQAIEICMATRESNGGLVDLDELYRILVQQRGKFKEKISQDDLVQALKNLKILGSGFQLITTGKRTLVQSIPADMGNDPEIVLNIAEQQGGVISIQVLQISENWSKQRAETILTQLLHSSQAWLDIDNDGTHLYWFPSLLN